MAEQEFAGKVVVITGAGCGLGFGIARRFGQAGAHVIITDSNPQKGQQAAQMLIGEGLKVVSKPLQMPITDPRSVHTLIGKLVNEHGQVDVWVNNAEVLHVSAAERLTIRQWEESLAVNLSSAFYCAQAVARQMLAQGSGVIINVAAMDAYQSIEGYVAYSASKAGLVALTQALGIEWAKRGVRVVGIAPGVVLTDLMRKTLDEGAASVEKWQRRIPMHRLGTVDEIAEAVLYLASDQASYIVGETMRVDGGWTAYQLF